MSKAQLQTSGIEERNAKAAPEGWARFCLRFKSEVGDAVYSSWFKCLELDQVLNGVAYLSVPTKFLKSWIHAHYFEKLKAIVVQELPDVGDIVLNLRATKSDRCACRGGAADGGSWEFDV